MPPWQMLGSYEDERLHFVAAGDGWRACLDRYLERVRTLLRHQPAQAAHWAELVPLLVERQPADVAAPALGVAATACIGAGKIAEGLELLDQAEALEPPAAMLANLAGRRIMAHYLRADWPAAWRALIQARRLGTCIGTLSPVLEAQLSIQEANLENADGDSRSAVRLCLRVLGDPALDQYIRQAAIYTCAKALAALAPSAAARYLSTVYSWRATPTPSRAELLMGWIDGRVRAQVDSHAQT